MMPFESGGPPPHLNNPSAEQSRLSESDGSDTPRTRNLQLFQAGPLQLGIFQNEIATTVEWREPAPLPYAPRSVLGVVSVQGRMLTVLNLATLLSAHPSETTSRSRHIVAIRGDEQLALAVDDLGETIGISDGRAESENGLFLRVFELGDRKINILNTKQLFAAALHGRERRRRRF